MKMLNRLPTEATPERSAETNTRSECQVRSPGNSPVVELKGVHKKYGNFTALHPLNLRIHRGEFLAILGPSGCGKTTLLKIISGFVEPSGGAVCIDGEDVTARRPNRRPTNIVFQGYGLFPHMNAAQNIAYGLRIAGVPRREARQRVDEALALVHMEGFGDKPVSQLSGGQAQRIALARALVMKPKVLLLDEPLAALDLKLRKAMQRELRTLHSVVDGTFVFVTHDQEEAMALASRICVMQDGNVVQDGVPEEVYSEPASKFVADFIGEANLIHGNRSGGEVCLDCGGRFRSEGPDELVTCVIRPERLAVHPGTSGDTVGPSEVSITGTLEDVVFLGPSVKYRVISDNDVILTVDSRLSHLADRMTIGSRVTVVWNPEDHRVFPRD